MSNTVRRPNLREQLGVAFNASSLRMQPQRETQLLRVAAMGAASLAVRLGADLQNVPIAGSRAVVYGTPLDERDVLASDLSPMLWHIRYGDQIGMIPRAVVLFAAWIENRGSFADCRGDQHHQLRIAFSDRLMHEWLSDRCASCGGSRRQERSRTGRWLRPRGAMQRNAIFRPCSACDGTGRAPVRHPERMKAMGLTREQYDAANWPRRFTLAMTWLNQLLPARLVRSLTAELERRTRRP